MCRRYFLASRVVAAILALAPALALADEEDPVAQTLCALMDRAAADYYVPKAFFTRLIWRESALQSNAVSPAGAQGIAQFMPGTAAERGLANPFDPEQAIPQAARYLSDLERQFGNYGLAAAAYNAGPDRVSRWLAEQGDLPLETQDYVLAITGHAAEDWVKPPFPATLAPDETLSCPALVALMRRTAPESAMGVSPFAPWGVQLAGSFSKSAALRAFSRTRDQFSAILGDTKPFVLASRLRSRGVRAFFRVRMPASTRAQAETLCQRLHQAGGACVVLRS